MFSSWNWFFMHFSNQFLSLFSSKTESAIWTTFEFYNAEFLALPTLIPTQNPQLFFLSRKKVKYTSVPNQTTNRNRKVERTPEPTLCTEQLTRTVPNGPVVERDDCPAHEKTQTKVIAIPSPIPWAHSDHSLTGLFVCIFMTPRSQQQSKTKDRTESCSTTP